MYIVKDNCGLPQCENYDEYKFSEFWELEEFLDDNPDAQNITANILNLPNSSWNCTSRRTISGKSTIC